MRFKPRAGIHGSGALLSWVSTAALSSLKTSRLPVLSFIKILVFGYLQAQPLELGLCNQDSDW